MTSLGHQTISTPLGRYLKEKVAARNLSLRAIAANAEISPSSLSKIINGKNEVPGIVMCNAIADYFNISRVKILSLAGWLDQSEAELLVAEFQERAAKDEEFAEFVKIIIYEKDADQRRLITNMMHAAIDCSA